MDTFFETLYVLYVVYKLIVEDKKLNNEKHFGNKISNFPALDILYVNFSTLDVLYAKFLDVNQPSSGNYS